MCNGLTYHFSPQATYPAHVYSRNRCYSFIPEIGVFQQRFNKRYRSEEHTSELQSLMRISYAVFCLKKKNNKTKNTTIICHLKQNNISQAITPNNLTKSTKTTNSTTVIELRPITSS